MQPGEDVGSGGEAESTARPSDQGPNAPSGDRIKLFGRDSNISITILR